jgi:hypothetical protein
MIGTVTAEPRGLVTLKSAIGATRIVDLLSGEQLHASAESEVGAALGAGRGDANSPRRHSAFALLTSA